MSLFRRCVVALLIGLGGLWAAPFARAGKPPLKKIPQLLSVYAATTGDDQNPGTLERPVATLAQALKVAREQTAHLPGGGESYEVEVRIVLRGGKYRLAAPLEITSANAANIARLRIMSHPGEMAVLSGGEEIRGWQAVGDLWQTEVPDVKAGTWRFSDLYVGDERRPRARTPNEGYLRVERAGDDKRTSFYFAKGDVQPWATPDEAEVVFLHDWSTSRIRVQRIDAAAQQLTFTDPIGARSPHYAIGGFEPHPRYFLEGAREFLDAPGEWHLDRVTGILTYKPLPGEQLTSFVAVAPRLSNLITLRGEEKKPLAGVSLEGLTLVYTAWLPSPHGYAGQQAGFYEGRDGDLSGTRQNTAAAVKGDLAQVTVSECQFQHLGGAGLWLESGCNHCTVERCRFDDIGGNGIMLGATVSFYDHWATGNILLTGNEVRRCGQSYFGAVGIWLGLVHDCTVEFCEVKELPYTGISLGWKWNEEPTSCRGNHIHHNAIHDCMRILSDGGGIYTLGSQPGTVLAQNFIYSIPRNAGRAESNGIFLDEGSAEIEVSRNTIYDVARSPIRFHKAARVTLHDNRLVLAPGVPAFRYNSCEPASMTLANNTEIEAANFTRPPDPARHVGPNRKAAAAGE